VTLVLVILALAFASTTVLTFVLMKVGLHRGILDIPNERSSHTSAVPRGGGLAIVITFLIFLITNMFLEFVRIDASVSWALIAGGTIVASIGVLDDLGHVHAKWRFVFHLVAAIVSMGLLNALPEIMIFGLKVGPDYFVFGMLVIALVWFANIFNFMDGIDGIASIEGISALASGALILFIGGEHDLLILFAYLIFALAGFLVWNWSPAKVFMGDACSGFLGLNLGLIAIATSASDAINVWSWVIIFGVFVVDATTTLLVRMRRGDTWYAAHRSHAYQILSRRHNSHAKVTTAVLFINLAWLLPLAVIAALQPYWGFPLCVVALLPLTILAVRCGAGRPDSTASCA